MYVCVIGHIRELRQNSNLVIYDVNIYLERIIAQLVKISPESCWHFHLDRECKTLS